MKRCAESAINFPEIDATIAAPECILVEHAAPPRGLSPAARSVKVPDEA
jgi:hypothetical protein